MKKKKHRTKSLAIFLAISICLCCISVSNVSASVVKTENDLQKERSVEQATLPENIQSLIPEEKRGDLVVTASADTDNAEMCTIRTENPETGEGTLFVHSSPIKYKDKNGDIHFIDTSMETISAKAKTNSGYAYRNAANSFTVKYGKTADIGINFDEAFTVVPVNNAPLERAETANASASAARPMSENGNGKLRYDGVFGSDTHVEYVNTTNGIKEMIILDQYTGTERFDFIFRSKTHIPLLAEGGAYILVAPKDKPEEPEYRFLSLYAYDAYEPDGTASTFRHMNEDLYYELTSNTDGSFIISVVVPDGYLTHPDIVYPVTIDPSVQKVANNSNVHDTYVNEAAPSTQSYYNYDYIRFGKSNGKKMFGYIRYTELPYLPAGATITSAYLKFTFRSGQNTPAASTNMRFWTLRVTVHQWNESTITWNNQPYGYDGQCNSFHYNGKYLDYVDADITDMTRGWYSGTANYGMDFTYEDEEYNDYNSVVSSEGDADRAPVLTLSYSIPNPSGVTISQTSASLNVGETLLLTARVTPSEATQSITWSSSNSSVATVSNGRVTCISSGTATIYAKSTKDPSISKTCRITVTPLLIYRTRNREKLGFANPSSDKDITPITPEDLQWGQKSTNTLISNGSYISLSDLNNMTLQQRITIVKNFFHSQISYDETFTAILDDMVDHFVDGTGTEYSNSALTDAVKDHQNTTKYVEGVKRLLDGLLKSNSGNISSLIYNENLWTQPEARNKHPLVAAIKKDELYEPAYSYGNGVPGLSLALNSLYGNKIEVTKYTKDSYYYSGVLQFTFYDHFGLDTPDLASLKYNGAVAAGHMPGFRQWYIMQHWNGLGVSVHPKPYVTKITFSFTFRGSI